MADIPVRKDEPKKQAFKTDENGNVCVTKENAAQLQVHFLAQIYKRLGYLIKMLEERK
jgi:hypothetical protein